MGHLRFLGILIIFYSCLPRNGSVTFGSKTEGALSPNPTITSLSTSGSTLTINGNNLEGVTYLAISDPGTGLKNEFEVISSSLFKLVAENLDIYSFPVNKTLDLILANAYGQSTYPVTFTLQPNAVATLNIVDGNVTTAKIPNGAVTRLKLNKEPSDNPVNNSPLVWSTTSNNFIFGAPAGGGGGGGSSGVDAINFGVGIVGAGDMATGTVPIAVNTGVTGASGQTVIPFFGTNNKIVLNSTGSTPNFTGLRFLDSSGYFDIFNDNALRITRNPNVEIFHLDYNGALSVGGSAVCTQATGCSGIAGSTISSVTATAPLAASGTTNVVIRALTPNQANNLVQLDSSGALPAVSGQNLIGVVNSITPGQAINVSNIIPDVPQISVVFGGTSTNAQHWYQNLDDIGGLAHNANAVIIGKDDGSAFIVESGSTLLNSILGIPSPSTNAAYVRWNGSAWGPTALPNCAAGTMVLSPSGNLTCSTFSSTIQLGTLVSSNPTGIQINANAGGGQLRFMDGSGGANYVGFSAPSPVTSTVVWTLPPADGTISGQALVTNASGTLSWSSFAVGNVVGPAVATSTAIARFSGTTGKIIQSSGVLIDNSNNVTGINNLTANGSLTINNNGSNSSIFPTNRGNGGQILSTNGAGNLSWQNPVVSDLLRVNYEEVISFNPVVLNNVNGWPGGAGTDPLVVPAGVNGMYSSNANWSATVYLPAVNPTVGVAMYYQSGATNPTTINNSRTNMTADFVLTTGNTATFVSNGSTWNFQGILPNALFSAIRNWPVYDSTGSFKAPGQIATGAFSITTGAIDWDKGNVITTTFNCGANITFANLKIGGTYTLIATNTATTQCSFDTVTTGTDAATVTYKFRPINTTRIASTHTLYTFMRVGTTVYVSWGSGF